MIKSIRTIVIVVLATLCFFSCEKPNSGISISFSAKALDTKAGAGSDAITQNSELSAFGLFAFAANNINEVGENIFELSGAERVTTDGINWSYEHTRYWEYGKQYRFRAYHPYTGNFDVNSSTADDISIEYKTGAATQSDLLFAFSSVEANTVNVQKKVRMDFKHALAALEFRIQFKNTVGGEATDAITSFYLKGLHPTATVHYTHSAGNLHDDVINWIIPPYFEEHDQFFVWTGEKNFGKAPAEPTTIFDGDHVVFAIPQTITAGRTKVYFTIKSSGSELFELPLNADTWEAGKRYVYTITLTGSHADLDLRIKNWNVIPSGSSISL